MLRYEAETSWQFTEDVIIGLHPAASDQPNGASAGTATSWRGQAEARGHSGSRMTASKQCRRTRAIQDLGQTDFERTDREVVALAGRAYRILATALSTHQFAAVVRDPGAAGDVQPSGVLSRLGRRRLGLGREKTLQIEPARVSSLSKGQQLLKNIL